MPHYKIYDNELKTERIVVADSKNIARSHVADQVINARFKIDVAKTAEVSKLMSSGIKPEYASKPSPPDQTSLPLPPGPPPLPPLPDPESGVVGPLAQVAGELDE